MPKTRRPQQSQGLLLARLIEDFLFEVEQTLAEGTYRAYQGPLSNYLRRVCGAVDCGRLWKGVERGEEVWDGTATQSAAQLERVGDDLDDLR